MKVVLLDLHKSAIELTFILSNGPTLIAVMEAEVTNLS